MRRELLLALLIAIHGLAGWGWHRDGDSLQWPQSGPMPDDPVPVRPYRYAPITSGAKSYRPIDPMPWGDVNKRVAPKGSMPGAPPATPKDGGGAPKQ